MAAIDAKDKKISKAIDTGTTPGTATITHTDDKLVFQYVLAFDDGDTTVTLEYDIKTQKAASPLTVATPPTEIVGITEDLFGKFTAALDISTLSKDTVIAFAPETTIASFKMPDSFDASTIAEARELCKELEKDELAKVNTDTQAALAAWKTLLSDEVSIDIKDIGFTSYTG